MINCIIVEDQPPAQRVLQKYIGEMDNLNLKATYADALQCIAFLKTEHVDLIFLDIHLPRMSGIDFLKSLKTRPQVILTTAFSDYALESYEYNVLDYLLKPFSFERFVQAVSKVTVPTLEVANNISNTSVSTSDILFIKSGYEHIKINIDEILYIKSDADYTEIFTNNKKHLAQESLRYWEANLDAKKFTRIHKSYIINIIKIEKISGNQVQINKNITIPIGRAFKEEFMKQVLN
ncbi:response regulator [Aurantibacter sp.]|uniref:LytR/AlgR family response regulator transcription factor n=1 Tax=Aurantibacter sp. TaxID=2807103 RepID=UPI0032659B93